MNLLSPRRIVHVQLAEPLAPLASHGDGRGLYAVFWLGDIPLGHEYFDVEELPIPRRDVAVIGSGCITAAVGNHLYGPPLQKPPAGWPTHSETAPTGLRPLAELRARRVGSRLTDGPTASVVVTTRDHPQGLARCLRSVQQLATRPLEVLIVDRSTNGQEAHAVGESFGYPVYAPPRPGDASPRSPRWTPPVNGDVVALTDDHSTVHPAWLGAVRAAFAERDVTAVSGLVLPAQLETETQVAFERLLSGTRLGFEPLVYDEEWLTRFGAAMCSPRLGSSANLGVRATSLLDMGVDWGAVEGPTLDRVARWELWWQVVRRGGSGRYEPEAVVFREFPRDPDEFLDAAFRWPCDLAAARSVDHGIDGDGRRPFVSSAPGLLLWAARNTVIGSPLERRAYWAGVAGWLTHLGQRLLSSPRSVPALGVRAGLSRTAATDRRPRLPLPWTKVSSR